MAKVKPVEDAAELGDGSITAALEREYPEGAAFEGHVTWVRVGEIVARIQAIAEDGVDADTVLSLAETRAACLAGDAYEPTEVPDDPLPA